MLKRYSYGLYEQRFIENEAGAFVRYEDAEKLQLRIIELEQQLKTQEQLRAEFEQECG